MKRSEMLNIIEDTLNRITGAHPETGDILYPAPEYISYCILKDIEKFGMLPPPSNRKIDELFVIEWEAEDED